MTQRSIGTMGFAKRIRDAFHALPDHRHGQWHALHAVDEKGVMRSMLCMASLEPGQHDLRLQELSSAELAPGQPLQTLTSVYGLTPDHQLDLLLAPRKAGHCEIMSWLLHGLPVLPTMQLDPLMVPTTMHMLPSDNSENEVLLDKASIDTAHIPDESFILEQHIWPCGKTNSRLHLKKGSAIFTSSAVNQLPKPEHTPHLIAALVHQASQPEDNYAVSDDERDLEQTPTRSMRFG